MLRLDGVTAGYGKVPVLRGVSLEARSGAITALIGSNGAGKTTTLRTILRILTLWEGSLLFGGESLNALSPREVVERGIAVVPEGRRIFPGMTVLENLWVGAFVCWDRRGVGRRVEEIFELFPRLAERRAQSGGTLSGGEQQMLAIGRALMSSPKLLLLDEPSMGLSPILVDHIFEVIHALRRRGTTILLVEQNARRALALADRAYVLESGRVVLSGAGEDLLRDPQVIDAYLGT